MIEFKALAIKTETNDTYTVIMYMRTNIFFLLSIFLDFIFLFF